MEDQTILLGTVCGRVKGALDPPNLKYQQVTGHDDLPVVADVLSLMCITDVYLWLNCLSCHNVLQETLSRSHTHAHTHNTLDKNCTAVEECVPAPSEKWKWSCNTSLHHEAHLKPTRQIQRVRRKMLH